MVFRLKDVQVNLPYLQRKDFPIFLLAGIFNWIGNSSSLIDFSHSANISWILGVMQIETVNLCWTNINISRSKNSMSGHYFWQQFLLFLVIVYIFFLRHYNLLHYQVLYKRQLFQLSRDQKFAVLF